jgi:mannose-6-phosphate isomerase
MEPGCFDANRKAFREQLEFSGVPSIGKAMRVMVQHSQIAVYAAAALSGRFPSGERLALAAAQHMIDRYEQADDAEGWIFALSNDGGGVDSLRDLYALCLRPFRTFMDHSR